MKLYNIPTSQKWHTWERRGKKPGSCEARGRKGGGRDRTKENGQRLGSHRVGKGAEVRIMQIKREQKLGSHEAG